VEEGEGGRKGEKEGGRERQRESALAHLLSSYKSAAACSLKLATLQQR